MKKKTFQQIENELLDAFLNEDDPEIERKKRLRRLGQIDENDEPTEESTIGNI